VFINKSHDGKIIYKSGLDSVIEVFGDKRKNRYTRFIVSKPEINIDYNYDELRKKVTDTFVPSIIKKFLFVILNFQNLV
jgi:hypothetical protein